jgi:CubicO group peptidase (beta-lactamase class C family)
MNSFSSPSYTIFITVFIITFFSPSATAKKYKIDEETYSSIALHFSSDISHQGDGIFTFERLEAYVETQMRQNRIPGMALAIVQGEHILHLQGYGNSSSSLVVTPQTPFYIGSVSKSLTALAVLQLVEQGLIHLDDPVQAYIPWFKVADERWSSEITVRHLLNQTSGLLRGDQNREILPARASIEAAVRNLKDVPPSQPPGESYHYFNANYTILGLLVEEVSGLPYDEYLHERIFTPLEMERSFTDPMAARAFGLAQGHTQMFGFPLPRQQPHLNFDLPAGFIITTAQDMAHYLIAQLNDGRFQDRRLLSPEGMRVMHQPPDGIVSSYAMGWEISAFGGEPVIQHSGGLETFYARAILLPQQGYGLAILINQNGLVNLAAYERIVDDLVRLLLESEPQGGTSLRLVYLVIAALVALDLGRRVFALLNIRRWADWAQSKSIKQIQLNLSWDLVVPLFLLLGLPLLSISVFGLSMTRVIIFYYLPDISLWILISALLSLVRGILKLRLYREVQGSLY